MSRRRDDNTHGKHRVAVYTESGNILNFRRIDRRRIEYSTEIYVRDSPNHTAAVTTIVRTGPVRLYDGLVGDVN